MKNRIPSANRTVIRQFFTRVFPLTPLEVVPVLTACEIQKRKESRARQGIKSDFVYILDRAIKEEGAKSLIRAGLSVRATKEELRVSKRFVYNVKKEMMKSGEHDFKKTENTRFLYDFLKTE